MNKKEENGFKLYRVMCEAEKVTTLEEQKLQPAIFGTDSDKWLTEIPDRKFSNDKIIVGTHEFILAFELKEGYNIELEKAVPQRNSKKKKLQDNIKFHKEGLKCTKFRNYGIPKSKLQKFNENVIRVYIEKYLGLHK